MNESKDTNSRAKDAEEVSAAFRSDPENERLYNESQARLNRAEATKVDVPALLRERLSELPPYQRSNREEIEERRALEDALAFYARQEKQSG